MKATELKRALLHLVPLKMPVFIWGHPGLGKSQICQQVAAELGLDYLDFRALLYDPSELKGLPFPDRVAKVTEWLVADFLPKQGTAGLMNLEELNAADRAMMAACYQLVLDRGIGQYRLPDEWSIVACGNLETSRSVTNKMPLALSNRFSNHLTLDPDQPAWDLWACGFGVNPVVVAFLRFCPDLIHKMPNDPAAKAWASPRTWHELGKLLDSQPPADIKFELVEGCVGKEVSGQFAGFERTWSELEDPHTVLMNPTGARVPSEPSAMIALASAVANLATPKNLDQVVTYLQRPDVRQDVSVMAMKGITARNPQCQQTRAYQQWSAANTAAMAAA